MQRFNCINENIIHIINLSRYSLLFSSKLSTITVHLISSS